MTSINPNTTHGQIATIIVDNLVDGEEGVKDQQEEEDLQREVKSGMDMTDALYNSISRLSMVSWAPCDFPLGMWKTAHDNLVLA